MNTKGSVQRAFNLRTMAVLSLAGMSYAEVASAVGLQSSSSVGRALSTPEGIAIREEIQKQQVALIHDRTLAKIEGASESAIDEVIRLTLDGESESIRLRAAQDILDRAGRRKDRAAQGHSNIPRVTVNVLNMDSVGQREGGMPSRLANGVSSVIDASIHQEEDHGGSQDGGEREQAEHGATAEQGWEWEEGDSEGI